MSKHTITSMIKGDLFAAVLLLEGEFIDLNYNGSDTYMSTNSVEVIGGLDVACIVRGLVGTEWKLTISEGTNELATSKSRTIELGNRDSFGTTVDIPPPEGSGAAKGGSKKGAAKKGGSKKGGQ